MDNQILMIVGVIDVGSNTARLLVAEKRGEALQPLREARRLLLLGMDIEREGAVRPEKLDETHAHVSRLATLARQSGTARLEVVVTAPGRQAANAEDLIRVLIDASQAPVRVLSPEEEGRYAWDGAVATAETGESTLAVCDVGGGSTELLIGTRDAGPAWARSFELGCLRLTERFVASDPPSKADMHTLRTAVGDGLAELAMPLPQVAVATGGTARALKKLVGDPLGPGELDAAVRRLSKKTAREIARASGVDRERARTLPAGALIVTELQRQLRTPLVVSSTGLREGVARSLLREAAAA